MNIRLLGLAVWLALLGACDAGPGPGSDRGLPPFDRESVARESAVSAAGVAQAVALPDPHAARTAMQILQQGGNAVDAAVAAGFVLAVTHPYAGNIGGGGFMTLFVNGEASFLDYRETAPAAATQHMYVDAAGEPTTASSLVGHRAAGVPGTVAGFWAAHQRFGTLPWERLLAPAVAFAEDGFEVSQELAAEIREQEIEYADDGTTNFRAYFGGWRAGQVVTQPELARTLETIAREGRNGFYGGETAALLLAEMGRGGGLISAADLAGYEVVWRAPIDVAWRNYRVITAPLPSSGGFALVQLLKMKDLLADEFAGLALNSAQYVHLTAEMDKRVFADRASYLGDPDFVAVPVADLLDDAYIAARARGVDARAISSLDSVKPGLEGVHTLHYSILDAAGNAVSNTYTLNTDFGSGVVVEGAGFLLNNEMDDFAIAPGRPNYYGVVGDEANAIEPGKRMLSSMTPTLLLRDGKVAAALGAMGGSTIFTSVYQVIVDLVDFGYSAEAALAAPRVHHQLLPPDLITHTPCCPLAPTAVDRLTALGYRVEPHWFAFGDMQLIWVTPEGEVTAASEPGFDGESVVALRVGDSE